MTDHPRIRLRKSPILGGWDVYAGRELLGRVWRSVFGLWEFTRERGGFGGNYPTRASAVAALVRR